MFDERFARQYRFEPPPEFLLASPYTSIVHHLSGPNKYALTHAFHRRSTAVDAARIAPFAPYTHFHCAYGFSTRKLACLFDSLVRVTRRLYESRFGRIAKAPQAC